MIRTRPGYTLMELLVVISILALLIAMLMPSLRHAKEAGRQASCLSNNRQLAVAWDNYTTDARGRIMDYTLNTASRKLWTQVLKPYFNDHELLVCPSTNDLPGNIGIGDTGIPGVRFGNAKRTWVEARSGYNAPEPFNRSSYMYNGNMFANSVYNDTNQRWGALAQIKRPSNVPILGDGMWRSQTPGANGAIKAFPLNLHDPDADFAGSGYDSVFRWVTNRHGNTTNVAFADDHAEAVPLNNMWSLQWHKTYEMVDFLD